MGIARVSLPPDAHTGIVICEGIVICQLRLRLA